MKTWIAGAGIIVAASLSSTAECAAGGFKAMAKELSRAAQRAGVERVAVLPFVPADGSSAQDGWSVSERLTTQVVRSGKVQTVERSLLKGLMEEHKLARTGMIDPRTLRTLGKIFSVNAVVAGSFVTLGLRVTVNARLIDVETGVIIAAVERQVERDWFDAFGLGQGGGKADSLWVSVPEFGVEIPPPPVDELPGFRDAVGDDSCADAPERIDRLEKQVLDVKARYWALRLKSGESLKSLTVNPGSTITDPLLKKSFYDRLRFWYAQDGVPALTPAEVQRFVAVDGLAYSLYRRCGV